MAFPLSWSRPADRFVIVFGMLALLLFVAEHVNGRGWMHDFRVYWGAADALLHSGPVYGVSHGLDSGVFKYAPVMALFFVPLAMLPYPLAAAIQFAVIVAAFLWASLASDRLLRGRLLNGRGISFAVLSLGGLVTVVHLHRELHLGNINMLLLAVLLLAIERMLQGKAVLAGVLFGVAMLAKPHFVVLFPLLLLRQRWTELGLALLTAVAGLLLPMLFLGADRNWALHSDWLQQMAMHNATLIYLGGDAFESVNTAYSFVHRGFLKHVGGTGSAIEAYSILAIVASGFGVFVLRNIRMERSARTTDPPSAFTMELLLLIALVPSITLTDTEHFLLSMPLVLWVLHHLLPRADPRWLALAAVPLLFAYGGNWEDALGPLSERYIHYGVLGLGNIGLLLMAVYLFERQRSNQVLLGTSQLGPP